jgi:monovalent cation/hydrogen antiporter
MTSMHVVTLCLLLIALTCAASLLARIIKLPLPFLQIAVGVVAALPPFNLQVSLDPDTFLLLFLPLLLFGDGWRLPRRSLSEMRWSVFGHAVGLVILTTVVGGYALHWLIPAMPLSVAFAVAALVSPTDAVALSSITANVTVPARMKHLLESEALLNDASGLVAMRFAIAATLSGGFSFVDAVGTFLLVGLGGIAVGSVLTFIYSAIHRRLLTRAGDATLQTVLVGLLPFAAFGLAEEIGASGILAAVAAGMTASRLSLLERAHFSARIQTGITWDVVSFCLNGIIFVLLGLQLPGIFGSGPSGIDLFTSNDRFRIGDEILELTTILIGLRLVWVLASLSLGWLGKRREGPENWRVIAASSIAGVRGAVTLAGALSIPLLMPDGSPFPDRDLAITLAVGIILASMLIAAIGLPLLLRGVPADKEHAHAELKNARLAAVQSAMTAVDAGGNAGPREAALLAVYQERFAALNNENSGGHDEAWRDLHRTALHAEREAVQSLRMKNEIDDVLARQLLHELDLLEAALHHRPFRLAVSAQEASSE